MLRSINRFFFILIFLFHSIVFSQVVRLSVTDEKGDPLKSARAFFYEDGSENYSEFSIIRNGFSEFKPKNKYENLRIKIVSESFYSEERIIKKIIAEKSYDFSFQLRKNKEYAIEEVVISKRKPIAEKKDTVTYNIERFADGTEVKLEDVLKKLPGIEVDDYTGSIKYKGKSIETITLDGDNLFDSNYTIGSKNINFDMVDQIEAIDNYQVNPLLVNAGRGDKVSLNVKLKKNILNLSGSANYNSGFFNDKRQVYEAGGNVVTLFNRLKSFTTFQYNNLGNSGANNFTGKDADYKYQNTIDETITTAALPIARWNFNEYTLGSLNLIYKHNTSLSFKVNYHINHQNILMREDASNFYQTDEVSFLNLSAVSGKKSLIKNYVNGELNYLPSKKLRINSVFTFDNDINSLDGSHKFNENNNFQNLRFRQNYIKSSTNFTKVFNNEDVLDVFVNVSLFKGLDDQFFFPDNQLGNLVSMQNVEVQKNVLHTYFNYYKKIKKIQIVQAGGFRLNKINFNSLLDENTAFSHQKNDVDYHDQSFFSDTKLKYSIRRWSFESSIRLEGKFINYNNTLEDLKSSVFLPANDSKITYVLSSRDIIVGNFNYHKKPVLEGYLYNNFIRTSFNTIEQSRISNDFQISKSAGIKYWHNDFENQFLINTFINYSQEEGQYFSSMNLSDNLISTLYFYSPRASKRLSHFFSVDKLIFLKMKVKFNTFYTKSNYINIINSQERNINVENYNFTLSLKSAFSAKLRFENEVTLGLLDFKSDVQTKNTSLQNKFTFVCIPFRSVSFVTEFYSYIPNRKQKTTFNFLDISVKYLPIKTKYYFSLSMKNVLNERFFVNTFTTDYSQLIQTVPLLPFHFSLGGGYRF